MHSHTNRRIANCAYTISYKADHRLIIMYIRKIWISSTISIHTMNAHMHHRCWRHRAQVRSAEAGICKVERFTATDLAISLQFRWDYFQDILIYYKCHVHTDTCDVYIIHVLCHLNIRCLYSYISCIIYIYACHQRRVPRIPRSQVLVGNHSQLGVFFPRHHFQIHQQKGSALLFCYFYTSQN